ncbi:hypothetical protein [Tunturiibacter lichenicola]|uniref:hypothetical protein n=1 Tax=Tunturiibacter lichenicola TaxID=2051959 RepID=UPI0021B25725|nr:hypothetical protein [Edaphobacter lichenicola]
MQARWRRRVAVVASYTVFGVAMLSIQAQIWDAFRHPYWVMWVMSFVLVFLGVFRDGALVKSFFVPKQAPAEMLMVGSLDEWARYRYGTTGFEESSAQQQEDLLKRYRVGTYLMPRSGSREHRPWLPDEREAGERDRASRRTLVLLGSYMTSLAGIYSRHSALTKTHDVVALMLQLVVMAITLPKAIVLWEEPDPREVSGEMELIDKKA